MAKSSLSTEISPVEMQRLDTLLRYERAAERRGFVHIAGVDEAGRGPLAGPVVAAACLLAKGYLLPGLNDSKQLSPAKRSSLYEVLTTSREVTWAVGTVDAAAIDRINIFEATKRAMREAVTKLPTPPDYLLVDGLHLDGVEMPTEKIIKGDTLSLSIAAASVIAKETRDALMQDYDAQWPAYGFRRHKGYGTEAHRAAIAQHGPCPIHRMSFAPLKDTAT